MFHRKKHYSIMGMDVDLDKVNVNDVKTVAKAVAAGFIVYQAAKYMFKEMMD